MIEPPPWPTDHIVQAADADVFKGDDPLGGARSPGLSV
jgi:hypothetical protein